MYIARQPIFDKKMNLYGYELLFRSELENNSFGNANATVATATVMGGLFEKGIEQIVDRKRAFVNFDYKFLLSDSIELINPDVLIIEVLESVKADKLLVDRLRYLRERGYWIALDDFSQDYSSDLLVPIADIIKYDIMATPLESIHKDVKKALKANKVLLAEKIETKEEFLKAKEMGFHLFQGYFFCKPSIISKSNRKKSTKPQYSRIMNELHKDEPSYQALAEIIETDVNLAYRLMRVIGLNKDENIIYSIKSSLIYMGFKNLERWMNILMLQELSDDKPIELLKTSLVRLRFGEYIADKSRFKERRLEISMMCLFSTIDAILDVSMEEALKDVALTEDVKDALARNCGNLRPVCNLICSYENGLWKNVSGISEDIGIDEYDLYKGYLKALDWADRVLSMM